MPENERGIQSYSAEALSQALSMQSTTSRLVQSQIGCRFFFDSVMDPCRLMDTMRMGESSRKSAPEVATSLMEVCR